MSWSGELQPISLNQIYHGKRGQVIEIEEDVLDIVKQIKQVDPTLHVRWSEKGNYFVVYCRLDHEPEGTGNVVLMVPELDQRVVTSIQKAAWEQNQDGYSLADALEAQDKEADEERDAEFTEQIAERAERLAYAIRQDLNMEKPTITVTNDLPKESK